MSNTFLLSVDPRSLGDFYVYLCNSSPDDLVMLNLQESLKTQVLGILLLISDTTGQPVSDYVQLHTDAE